MSMEIGNVAVDSALNMSVDRLHRVELQLGNDINFGLVQAWLGKHVEAPVHVTKAADGHRVVVSFADSDSVAGFQKQWSAVFPRKFQTGGPQDVVETTGVSAPPSTAVDAGMSAPTTTASAASAASATSTTPAPAPATTTRTGSGVSVDV